MAALQVRFLFDSDPRLQLINYHLTTDQVLKRYSCSGQKMLSFHGAPGPGFEWRNDRSTVSFGSVDTG